MKTLVIEWQRLLDDHKQTCPRCGATEQEAEKAVQKLNQLLEPSGIEARLVKKSLDPETFRNDVLQSNKILIAGKQMEEWLGARTGQSKCCETCGDAECRTVEYAGDTHEAIPADMIVRAGLTAAAYLFAIKPPKTGARIPVLKLEPRKA
jgi:hypothetical protein